MSVLETHTEKIRAEALRLGFSFIGFARAEQMIPEAQQLENWLNKGFHGKMQYMENHFDKRTDPRKLVEGAKSVISLMYNYHNPDQQTGAEAPKIAQYAYGEDYHFVVKDHLRALIHFIETHIGAVSGRAFVDSAPVLERDWARRSGIGWVGKNTLLINPKAGSYFFLAELILDLDLVYDNPIKDFCGTCRRCIEACPTEAISPEGYFMDGSKCISYLTIELKAEENIPEAFKGKMADWAFGCDICQQVCPWNRFSERHSEPRFEPVAELLELSRTDWADITETVFNTLFQKSPIKRTKLAGLKRNIQFLKPGKT
jgi:epoxyqueuosine reductase